MFTGEGLTIGIAAAKAGLPVRHDVMEDFVFFKDKIEQMRIRKGQADPANSQIYFDLRQQLSAVHDPGWLRVWHKLSRKAWFFWRLLLLKASVSQITQHERGWQLDTDFMIEAQHL